ncbi:SRPBCC family protein [Motilibacter aurantiacus]|uniref:SRPBCC family protein n=1 Tax=Motilibacter aurantiacus TaxID=2714955 RepID=UPI00140CF776|nr:SRPBCC family protein [Motilibacter aurantiacus]NHC45337.1 Shy6-polyketide cyclase [Motilibacter aurantiacus]
MNTNATHGDSTADVGIDDAAPVITRDSIVVGAPLALVWDVHTDLLSWTEWQPGVGGLELLTEGPLRPGTSFRWWVEGLDVTSTVRQVEPYRRLVWGGPANGIDGRHVWEFETVEGGVLVRTAESWSGEPVEADVAYAQAALDASLAQWLRGLKGRAEALAAAAAAH